MQPENILAGRYQLVKQIGKGGFGVVEQYRDLFTDALVAIKTIPSRFVDQETKRLVREVDIMLHLYGAHPHLMSMLDLFVTRNTASERQPSIEFDDEERQLGEVDVAEIALNQLLTSHTQSTTPMPTRDVMLREYTLAMQTYANAIHNRTDMNLHIVMPLMKGDLFYFCKHMRSGQLLAVGPSFLPQVCVVFAFQVCFGLDYLHRCNVVHRDLKPDNILVWLDLENAYKSTAVIADFGLARDAHATETFYICTRHYRPPEVITNTSRGDTSIDVWSLGCIFFELVTARTLFNLPTALNNKGQWEGIKASQQLEVILNTLGTPPKADIERYMPQGNAQSYLIKSRPRPSILTDSIRAHWRLGDTPVEEQDKWIDLISSCLKFFPQQRPTADQLCAHQLFRDYNVLYGENVKQYEAREYAPVTFPPNCQKSDLKDIVLSLVRRSIARTLESLGAARQPTTAAAETQDAATLATTTVRGGLAFPAVDDPILFAKFSNMLVATDAQVDDALDEVLNAMELYTHDANVSRQLRSLLTYFAGLKQLPADEPVDEVAAAGGVTVAEDL